MRKFSRITSSPEIMGGKACIRGMRITVSMILNLIASGMAKEDIISEYPSLEVDDINECLKYAAFLAEEELYLT
ncbi:DUF433 domain-containing protein [Mucilaginibacter sp. RS28]|uniref:DUF433 domain-containing protein n=1 Tax=Mucilaginibacter straminoryzae TaxID=2932774 RepID=A0A9X2BD38_9SPHI|nr:DUF433 domain-containing protein [Mucilaginibacter straminoryzae]MCJ8211667.1 DUF433 domain-containing protein [Mucilaginibacter straminoryzae]